MDGAKGPGGPAQRVAVWERRVTRALPAVKLSRLDRQSKQQETGRKGGGGGVVAKCLLTIVDVPAKHSRVVVPGQG